MSFFKSITNGLTKVAEQSKRDEERNNRRSAIPPGRMRETDVIKGKDCEIPSKPGMYRHVDKKTGKADYIGQSNNMRKRQQEHQREGRLNTDTHKVQYSEAREGATKDDLCRTEKDHIERHNPSGNTYGGGNGRR